ncbi:hypothetical protein J7E26_03625 [Bacillus sp. ISL-51]|uniref:hypothetical protein n=1 Tax=Bacteria TaxID=2 RepID=UPI001BE96BEC|nr:MULTISPECIES: hypothetical protein [Bacteria]MBT2573052.1 hypothetical protein [Bacillus sp. ISL-51]MBT2633969.1 hypothetical protein [Bacillus sp. ISL-26]MBT2713526.1 hypothetical protein [Pseudomonas sp. ISL-88]
MKRILLFRHSQVLTGGTAFFFLINIPFYVFFLIRMGVAFTISTVFVVTMLTLFTGSAAGCRLFHFRLFPELVHSQEV